MIWFIIISLVWHVLRVNADCVYPDLGTQIAYLEPYRPDGYDDFETVYIYCNETIPYVAQASICLFGVWMPEFPTEICNDPCQVPVADGMTYSRLAGQTDGVIFTHGSRISFTCERGDPGPTTSTCNDGVWEPPVLCPETTTMYLTTPFVSPAQASTNGRTGGTEFLTTQPQTSITSGAPISHSTVDHFTTTTDTDTDHTSDALTSKQITSMPSSSSNDMISNSHMEAHSTLSPVTDDIETNSASTEQTDQTRLSLVPILISALASLSAIAIIVVIVCLVCRQKRLKHVSSQGITTSGEPQESPGIKDNPTFESSSVHDLRKSDVAECHGGNDPYIALTTPHGGPTFQVYQTLDQVNSQGDGYEVPINGADYEAIHDYEDPGIIGRNIPQYDSHIIGLQEMSKADDVTKHEYEYMGEQ